MIAPVVLLSMQPLRQEDNRQKILGNGAPKSGHCTGLKFLLY